MICWNDFDATNRLDINKNIFIVAFLLEYKFFSISYCLSFLYLNRFYSVQGRLFWQLFPNLTLCSKIWNWWRLAIIKKTIIRYIAESFLLKNVLIFFSRLSLKNIIQKCQFRKMRNLLMNKYQSKSLLIALQLLRYCYFTWKGFFIGCVDT